MRMICIGGRIKAAAVGMEHLVAKDDPVELERHLAELRRNPSQELLEAFFPSDKGRLKQLMRSVGFYRPILKTEQGMAGNFLPFWIDQKRRQTDFILRKIINGELLAVPEIWFPHDPGVVKRVQEQFYQGDFMKVYDILETLDTRTAEKGRTPFFFIRPAMTDSPIIFGNDIVTRVEDAVQRIIKDIVQEAVELEKELSGSPNPSNLIYCQPDIYVLRNGEVAVERVNMPDVGLFLGSIRHPQTKILPQIQDIVIELEKEVCDTIVKVVSSDFLVLLTRRQVMEQKEDLLEIMEMERIATGLAERGMRTEVRGIHEIGLIPTGTPVLLMNLDYVDTKETETLFKRHSRGEIFCYPNPFVQLVCRKKTGLKTHLIPKRHEDKFLQLIGGIAKEKEGERKFREQLERRLSTNDVRSNILHADIGSETVPIFRPVLHSWRQLAKRARRNNEREEIRLIEITANPDTLLISSSTGPRLHVFRFMFVVE